MRLLNNFLRTTGTGYFSRKLPLEYKSKLNDGNRMPMVGLGTWRAQKDEVENAVKIALENGYRHIDTAFNYNTEEPIGNVLKAFIDAGKCTRNELFITTKLPNFGNRPSDVERYLDMSLERLGLNYVDLYLIHMPFSFLCDDKSFAPKFNENGVCLDLNNDIIATWKEMERQVKRGKIKSIGLSNFNEDQIKRIYDSSDIKPAVLQVELHAYFQQKNLRKFCKQLGIAVTAYSPLGSPGVQNHFSTKYNYNLNEYPDLLNHPTVLEIARKYEKSPGQILLKHLIQQDVIVIPKSANPDRIKSNIDIFNFDLDDEDLKKIDGLDKSDEGRIFDFLFFKGVESHPEYPFKIKKKLA